MKRVLQMWLLALAVLVGVSADARPAAQEGSPRSHGEMSSRLSRRGSFGRINIQGGKKHFPEGAEVSIERKRPDDVKRKIHQGWSKRKRSGKSAASPNILASYDISIRHGGRKWQPDAGDPVRVTVDLDEPVAVTAASTLGVVHLSDDGTVEELPASRCGFTYNADKTAVTAFWFSASGFSIYSIIDNSGVLVTPRRFYHFYDRPTSIAGSAAVSALPYRYVDSSNEIVNVQIVKDGDALVEPPIPPDVVDVNSNLVSTFEGWYVVSNGVHTTMHGLDVAEGKLDSTAIPFEFVWPTGVTSHRLSFTNTVAFAEGETGDTDYFVVPLYEHSRFVQFYESAEEDMQAGSVARIVGRRLVALNDETHAMRIRVSDVTAPLRNSRGEYFSGWEYYRHRTDAKPTQILTYSAQGVAQEAFLEVDDSLFEENRTEENGGHTIPMWPVYVEAHFLSFSPALPKGSGATYVGSLFVKSDTDIRSVETSARPGYDFGGWWTGTDLNAIDDDPDNDGVPNVVYGQQVTDASGNMLAGLSSLTNHLGETVASTDAGGRISLNADVTLYAKWIPQANATYRVIIWQQKVTDAKDAASKTYDYVTHYTSGKILSSQSVTEAMLRSFSGTNSLKSTVSGLNVLSATALADRPEVEVTGMSFTGFETTARWAVSNAETDGTVKSDNSTIVNVYFDRKLITLTFESTYSFTKTTNANTTGTFYGEEDGANYFQVYYNAQDGKWYKTRANGYDYYGKRYNRGNNTTSYYFADSYSGDYYTKNGNTYSRVTNGNYSNNTQYYGVENGEYFPIYRSANGGVWYKVQSEAVIYAYSDPYAGDRYTASTGSSTTFTVMTGLYGQTLARYGYTWPSMLVWKEDANTTLTFLDAFMPATEGDMTYSSTQLSANSGNTKAVSFFKQKPDGTYDDATPDNSVLTAGSQFTVTEKYNGFSASQYRTNGGNWNSTSVGSKISSGYDTLDIRFARNEYEFIFRDSDTGEDVFITNLLFEASFAGLDLSPTNKLINWKGRDQEHYTFEGWFEDASGTTEFDFANGKMGTATKVVFAVWKPIQYKVVIDPNGGQLEGDDSTWFYVDYNETVKEYTPTRDYRLDMDGEFYYSYHPWDPLGDKHVTPQNSPEFIPNISRRAYYTDDAAEATDTFNRYAYEPGAYRFMGWYEVLDPETGAMDSAPFAFGTRHNRPLMIRAIWQRSGLYVLKYESIDPSGERATETWYDPEGGRGGYIDEGVTTLSKDPTNYDRDEYIWEGWQVVDPRQNNLPLTNIRSPGDVYIVHASHADSDNVIHMRAVYSRKASGTSSHVPDVVDLVLDSNDGAGLVPGFSVDPALSGVGTYTGGTAGNISGLNAGIWFAGRQNNFSVNLAAYASAFAHTNGFFLLGWDTNRVAATGIPAYYANETIGVDKAASAENVLYAVWEPQIYIEFVNDTGAALDNVKLYIPGWTEGEIFRVNSVQDTYRRSPFTAFQNGEATFNMAADETICLVLPDGAEKVFTAMGTCTYQEGNKLVITRIQPQIEGQEAIPDYTHSVYPGEEYMVAGTMKVSPTPVQVRFTKTTYPTTTDVPVRYFIHHPDGSVEEITADDATVREDDTTVAAWGSQKPLKTISNLGSATNDLAATLRHSTTMGVKGFLNPVVQEHYGHTTIGIGSRSATVTAANFSQCEYRTITNIRGQPRGGSYLRFAREDLMWSRYSQIWNSYDASDTAVYVAFYQRIPVHVTLQKTVVGSEEDKNVPFTFTATYSEHSTNIEYTVTQTYTQTREWSRPWYFITYGNWSAGNWSDPVLTGVSTNVTGRQLGVDTNLFDQLRSPETVVLKNGERHPFTIFYDRADPQTASTESTDNGKEPNDSGSGASGTSYTQTRTITQVVTYNAAYRYEKVTIQEGENANYVLSAIGPDPVSQSAGHSGTANLGQRTYTISSMRELQHGANNPNYYDYTPLDTTVFTNTRKTGSVTVTKTVEGGREGDEGDEFPFTVTLGETVVGKDTYVPPDGANIGPYGKVFTFSLANGGSMTLPGLPAGASYMVEEGAHAKYVATVPANATGTVAADTTISVGVTNTRKTDLAIAINDLTLEYNGAEQRGHDISTVEGAGSTPVAEDAYSVTGLKSGDVLTVQHHVPAQGKAVGSYAGNFNNARITVARSATGEDVTGEYLVTTTPGSLTIVPAQLVVTIVGNTDTRPWNATEQAVEGYTYTVVRKSDSAPVSDDEVHPVIEPAYSKAKGSDVGTYYMSLLGGAAVGFVKDDGYQIAPEDIHVTNGSLTITPRPATVTADDKAKILGASDPALTATVAGLLNSDTLSYTLSRAPGEAEGTYAITASGAADQGNYTVTYAPGTFTIRPLTLIQRATGEGLPVTDAVGGSLLASLGIANPDDATPEVVDGLLNQMDPNGLRRWENLRTGTEPTQLLLSTAAAGTSQIAAQMAADPGAVVDLGYTMLRELRKEQNGTWVRVAGPAAAGNPSFPIGLEDEGGNSVDASGLYRVVTLLVPNQNTAITNEIPSTNIIGVLEVNSAYSNTITAVPWRRLASDPQYASDVCVSNYVSTVNLTPGDSVYMLKDNTTYEMWTLQSDGTWGSVTTVGTLPGDANYQFVAVATDADKQTVPRGNAVWVARQNPLADGRPKPYFLVGQYAPGAVDITIAGGAAKSPAYTQVAVPDYCGFRINDLDWGANPGSQDMITIPSGAMTIVLYWVNGSWGSYQPVWDEKVQRKRNTFVPYDDLIPAGTGFWYTRRAGAFTLKWQPAKTVE